MHDLNRFSLTRRKMVPSQLCLLLLPFIASLCMGAHAQSSCSGAPVQVDETVGRLHIAKVPVEFQDQSEFRQLSGAKMSSRAIRMSQMSVLQIEVDTDGRR